MSNWSSCHFLSSFVSYFTYQRITQSQVKIPIKYFVDKLLYVDMKPGKSEMQRVHLMLIRLKTTCVEVLFLSVYMTKKPLRTWVTRCPIEVLATFCFPSYTFYLPTDHLKLFNYPTFRTLNQKPVWKSGLYSVWFRVQSQIKIPICWVV